MTHPGQPEGFETLRSEVTAEGPVLLARSVRKRFGGVHALRGVDLDLWAGEIHSLVGENGSGKSTLLRILSGQLQPDAGELTLDGEPVRLLNPSAALRRGIAMVSQEISLCPELSVAENILMGRGMLRGRLGINWRTSRRRAVAVLERLGMDLDPSVKVWRLRPDQRQMVEIARAVSRNVRILILDEPTSSLTDDEVEALFRVGRKLQENGVATIFVSHRLDEVFALSDRITVLRDGNVVGAGEIGAYSHDRLISEMVGRALGEITAAPPRTAAQEAVLRVRELNVPGRVFDVSFDVASGEVLGLAGLVGAGRGELLEALFGMHSDSTGRVELAAKRIRALEPADAIAAGLAYVPPDRRRHGLVLDMSVQGNMLMAATSRLPRWRTPNRAQENRMVNTDMHHFGVRAPTTATRVGNLSGGNQQKVVLAKWLRTNPRVLLLDEPTRGVDVGAKADIYRLLDKAKSDGTAVLISSSEPSELQRLCDRILVMYRGRIVADLPRHEATEAVLTHFGAGGTA